MRQETALPPRCPDNGTTRRLQTSLQYAALGIAVLLLASLARPATTTAGTDQPTPVTARGVGGVSCEGTASLQIRVTRVDSLAGAQGLKVKGEFDLDAPIEGGLDPATSGAALVILSAGDAPLYSVTVPPGAYSRETSQGWKPSAQGGRAQWKSRTGIDGLTKVKLEWDDATGQGSFDFRGKDLSLAVTGADLPLHAEVWLDAVPVAERCGLANEVDPEGECAFNSSGSTLSCDIFGTSIPANPCASPVVRLRTGPNSSCGSPNTHTWPVGIGTTGCHGWRALDGGGQAHDNSANNIRCNPDGSFSFVQFAGNLDCAGSGTTKDYVLNVCEQDTPPSIYTMAFDLSCCSNPADPACRTEVPAVSAAGSSVFLNGVLCVPE